MSDNSEKITVAMAKMANIALGRDAESLDEANDAVLKLAGAFKSSLNIILSENDSKHVRPYMVFARAQGLTCIVGPSEESLMDVFLNEAWDNAVEKLAVPIPTTVQVLS